MIGPASDADAAMVAVRASITHRWVAQRPGDRVPRQRWPANQNPSSFRSWVADAENFCVVALDADHVQGVGLLHGSGDASESAAVAAADDQR
jgi:hypothetical protein